MAAALLLILLLVAPAAHAVQHNVGGSSGWSLGVDYSAWATSQKFHVGDTLLFIYSTSHAVDEVSQDDYNNCNIVNSRIAYFGGQTFVTLTKPGPMYFICPTLGHCQSGMKMAITVAAAAAAGTTPSTGTSPTTPFAPPGSTSSSTPSITTNTPPSHTYSAASGKFGEMKRVVIGFSVVVAMLVAFMS